MIIFLEGILENKNPNKAIINAGGIGYEVIITADVIRDLAKPVYIKNKKTA